MPPDRPPSLTFASVARLVRRRVWLRRWLVWLRRTVPYVLVVQLAAVLATLLLGHSPAVAMVAVFLFWLASTAIETTRQQPSAFAALALWDSRRGQREAFASAWWFEQEAAPSAAMQAHIEAQQQHLAEALPQLGRDLPLSPSRWLAAPVVVGLLLGGLVALSSEKAESQPMDAAMQEAAKKEGEKLAQTDWEKKQLPGLTAEEKAALEQLKENLKATAEDLKTGQGQDARQVMSELERRAREAEKLAEKLGQEKNDWASDKLVQALRTHADTADLGDAVATKSASQGAAAADALAQQLKAPDLATTTKERFEATLSEIHDAAEPEDRQRLVGQHVLSAADQMKQNRAAEAGAEFEQIAVKLRDQALREKSREELEKLAQQLRDSGSNINGQKDAGEMQPMTAANGNQNQNSAQQSQSQQQQQQQSQGQNGQASAPQSLQPPGLGQMQQSQMLQQQQPQQQPGGQGQQPGQTMQQMQMGQAQQPGQQGQGKNGPPMLLAPDPRKKDQDKPPEFLIMGDVPNPDAAVTMPGMTMATPGGSDPGAGRAELKADATGRQESGQTKVVNAQQNQEGQSSVRTVEGGIREEQATRGSTQTAVEFLQAEEEALDDAALPPSRREQVRRYFNELRRRFEKQP